MQSNNETEQQTDDSNYIVEKVNLNVRNVEDDKFRCTFNHSQSIKIEMRVRVSTILKIRNNRNEMNAIERLFAVNSRFEWQNIVDTSCSTSKRLFDASIRLRAKSERAESMTGKGSQCTQLHQGKQHTKCNNSKCIRQSVVVQ